MYCPRLIQQAQFSSDDFMMAGMCSAPNMLMWGSRSAHVAAMALTIAGTWTSSVVLSVVRWLCLLNSCKARVQ